MSSSLLRRCAPAVVATALLCLQGRMPVYAMQADTSTAVSPDETLRKQFEFVAHGFDDDVQRALNDIEGQPRRLLALRSYVRAGKSLRSRWSWTEAEIAAFQRSAQCRQMLADIQRLTAQFEVLNPGFTLYVNTEVRSLGVQLERWNKNRAVGLLADELMAAVRARPADDGQQLRQFLSDWRPSVAAPLAAPGLSLHGRGQALDFQIRKGERIIAGTEAVSVRSVWDAAGWTEKLQRAVQRSGAPLRGPLLAPREPWHYVYVPEGTAVGVGGAGTR